MEDGVPVREGAAFGVLAREADRDPFAEQRPEREGLSVPPVDSALLEGLSAAVKLALQLRVNGERLRHGQKLLVQRPQRLRGNRRRDLVDGRRRDPLLRVPGAAE